LIGLAKIHFKKQPFRRNVSKMSVKIQTHFFYKQPMGAVLTKEGINP
jgi:hypothetical protein